MRCTYCGDERSKVIDSRDSGEGVRRRRECQHCERRFTTMERVVTRSIVVVKRDDRREDFSRDKLVASLTTAFAKRPMPTGAVDKAADDIEASIVESGRAEVRSQHIGELVMERLVQMDSVAFIRYASVYRSFSDIAEFTAEVDALRSPAPLDQHVASQLSFLDEPLTYPARRKSRSPRPRPRTSSRRV